MIRKKLFKIQVTFEILSISPAKNSLKTMLNSVVCTVSAGFTDNYQITIQLETEVRVADFFSTNCMNVSTLYDFMKKKQSGE